MALPTALYTTAQARALDAHAIAHGTPGYTLMGRAGEAALRILRARWPISNHITVVCGGGNNGGDGYVVARLAREAGLSATVMAVADPTGLRGDARRAFEDFRAGGGQVQPLDAAALRDAQVVVDALLGTGLTGAVRPDAAAAIHAINASGRPVLALDVPSGLDSEDGRALGEVVQADSTVTFVALKTGLLLGVGPERTGQLYFDGLEVTVPDEPGFTPSLERITEACVLKALPRRPRQSNKGDFGRVLIVGGGQGMPGAVRMAGEACLRVGAGLVTVATQPENLIAVVTARPELICLPVSVPGDLQPALERADVVAIGPGLGRTPWAQSLVDAVLACDKPLVVDADALNIIAARGELRRDNWILTPHPGEASRLLRTDTATIQADRRAALAGLLRHYGGITVLKGAGTLVGCEGRVPGICERGNPGMASAGMGDVLTGAMAGVLAQCRGDAFMAARAAVMVHAMAGDIAARAGERGLVASDVARELQACVNL